jgi:hypothetical protein
VGFSARNFRSDVPQSEIVIGIPEFGAEDDVTLIKMLIEPFTAQRITNYEFQITESNKSIRNS